MRGHKSPLAPRPLYILGKCDFPFTSHENGVLYCSTICMQDFIYLGPNYFAFRRDISYENGEIISAEETSAYGLQEFLHNPAPPNHRNVHNTRVAIHS